MKFLRSKAKIYDGLVCLGVFLVLASLVIFPQQSVAAAKDGVTLCLNVIVPSLFPFFVLSSLVVEMGYAAQFGHFLEPMMRTLFHVRGACATPFVLGFIGGYPVGARSVIALYANGDCTKAEAERMLSFCNNSGPAFILGVVGAGIFASSKVGILLYVAHMLSSILIGICFRNWHYRVSDRLPSKSTARNTKTVPFAPSFVNAVQSSFLSTLNICGFVIFFTVIIRLLFLAGILPFFANLLGRCGKPLGLDAAWAERFLTGLIELSSGVWSLQSAAAQLSASMAMAAFMLGWAGLSVHCQVLSFIGNSGLSVRTYLLGKFFHGILSAILTYILVQILPFHATVATFLAAQVTDLASLSFQKTFLISGIFAILLFLFLHTISFFQKKSGKKRRNSV